MDICDVCDYGMLSADAEYYPCSHCIEGNSFSISEHDKTIRKEERKKTLEELWKKAIYMHDEYIEYEELENIIDEMLKGMKNDKSL